MSEERQEVLKTAGDRDQVIVRTSILGILTNVFLAVFKAVIGILSNSIAVTLDAVNNLSDALSSVITIIGTRLAGKLPDKKHPLGYGRIEYLSTMIISALVLYAGITAMVESVKKLFHPEAPDYSALTLIILAAAVAVKLMLGSYFRRTGKRVSSGSLQASGSDALSDAILSAAVLVSAIIYLATGVSLEALVSVIIAVFIIRAGLEMLTEAVDDLLGKRLDPETTAAIKATICGIDPVSGAYDLILNSYGPERVIGSVHVEVPDTMNAAEIDRLERKIAYEVYSRHGILMTAIGIYAQNTSDDRVAEMRTRLTRMVMSHEGILQVQGVHDGGEHADVVGLVAVHVLGRAAAEQIAAAHHDGQLHAIVGDLLDLPGDACEHRGVDAVALIAGQGLTGELQQSALVLVSFGHLPSLPECLHAETTAQGGFPDCTRKRPCCARRRGNCRKVRIRTRCARGGIGQFRHSRAEDGTEDLSPAA